MSYPEILFLLIVVRNIVNNNVRSDEYVKKIQEIVGLMRSNETSQTAPIVGSETSGGN